MLPQPILVSDEEIEGNEWYLWNNSPIKNHIVPTTDGDMWSNNFHKSKLKIIAGIPELPVIDFSTLSEEDCKKIELFDVEKIANEYYDAYDKNKEHTEGLIEGFIQGFKKAQALNEKKYSEEDMIKAWENGIEEGSWTKNKPLHPIFPIFIKSLSQPKVFDVEVEMDFVHTDHVVGGFEYFPKVTNNQIKITKIL